MPDQEAAEASAEDGMTGPPLVPQEEAVTEDEDPQRYRRCASPCAFPSEFPPRLSPRSSTVP